MAMDARSTRVPRAYGSRNARVPQQSQASQKKWKVQPRSQVHSSDATRAMRHRILDDFKSTYHQEALSCMLTLTPGTTYSARFTACQNRLDDRGARRAWISDIDDCVGGCRPLRRATVGVGRSRSIVRIC
jgi:hypothetical protein